MHRFAAAHPLEGEQPRHVADTWMQTLLDEPPLLVAAPPVALRGGGTGSTGGGTGGGGGGDDGGDGVMIDPHQIADEIMRRRVEIASSWRDELTDISGSMLALKREWLNRGL